MSVIIFGTSKKSIESIESSILGKVVFVAISKMPPKKRKFRHSKINFNNKTNESMNYNINILVHLLANHMRSISNVFETLWHDRKVGEKSSWLLTSNYIVLKSYAKQWITSFDLPIRGYNLDSHWNLLVFLCGLDSSSSSR